jgi:hypothetical protein
MFLSLCNYTQILVWIDEMQCAAFLNRQMEVLYSGTLAHDGRKVFEVCREPYKSLSGILGMYQYDMCISTLLETRASAIASAIAKPSRVLVPRPSSSTMALHVNQHEHSSREYLSDVNLQATSIDVAQNKCNLLHLRCKCRYIGLDIVVHTEPRE